MNQAHETYNSWPRVRRMLCAMELTSGICQKSQQLEHSQGAFSAFCFHGWDRLRLGVSPL